MTLKELVLKLISWGSIIANIVHCELENSNNLEDHITCFPNLINYLTEIDEIMDSLKLFVPQEPILEITLLPDQKQLSATKTVISTSISRMEEIEQENKEAEKDWGMAEQNAYERILERGSQNIPAEEFLEWLTELEEGKDV